MTTSKNKTEKHYKKPLGQLKIEKFCSDNNNLIQNYISYLYKNTDYKIKLMTNSDAATNRNSHCGAHIYVETAASNDYYYITTSRKDYYCQNFLTINTNLLPLIKQATFNYKVLLFNNGKIYRFDKWVFDDKENKNGFVNIPLDEAEDVYKFSNDDFRTPEKYINIEWHMLGRVRYSNKFDMHKKPVYIELNGKRVEYQSVESAWANLSFHYKDNNGKWQLGKGRTDGDVQMYRKGFTSFKNDLRKKTIEIYVSETKALRANIDYVAENSETACKAVRSILVVDNNTTNIDQTESVCENRNNEKDGGKRHCAKRLDKKLDKELDIIADKLAESETVKYTPADILRTVASYGSNKNMLAAYTLSLTEKGLYKEATYAAKLFDAVNNINFD